MKAINAVLLALAVAGAAWAGDSAVAGAEAAACAIRRVAGVTGGVTVHVGCGDGTLTAAFVDDGHTLVQGLDRDETNVRKARERFRALKSGGRISAMPWDGGRLPYADNLVNLLLVHEGHGLAREELLRVLVPGGATVTLTAAGQPGEVVRKPWPDALDEWSHFLHGPDNNAVSRDRLVGPPRRLQWIDYPVFATSHGGLASLSAMVSTAGRLYSIENGGAGGSNGFRLLARDAFNGVHLWERPVDTWIGARKFRSGPVDLPRRLVAGGGRVYVTLSYAGPLQGLDADTGETVRAYKGTEGADEVLLADGVLYVAAPPAGTAQPVGRRASNVKKALMWSPVTRRILALRAQGGELLWAHDARPMCSGSLTVGGEHVFLHDGEAVVALNRSDGREAWKQSWQAQIAGRHGYSSPTLVYADGVLLCADRVKGEGSAIRLGSPGLLTAYAAPDGSKLWEVDTHETFCSSFDVFVIDGLVWATKGDARAQRPGRDVYYEVMEGRDLRTGAVKKTVDTRDAFTSTHHHRCYRNKATGSAIILGDTGIEFVDLTGGPHLRHTWTRGVCQYGVLPANGLLYAPPNACSCYAASQLDGFIAYGAREAGPDDDGPGRLHRGPAYAAFSNSGKDRPADPADWPTFRANNARGGSCRGAVADRYEPAWRRMVLEPSPTASGRQGKGRGSNIQAWTRPDVLSAPTAADGKVFVCEAERHAVHALDLETGNPLWTTVAGGRVDSPPTYWLGRVYFGSADGHIRCLDAETGSLIWRYRAAPRQESVMAWRQLESPWPIAGSVLVREGAVFALAGRSSYLDGGVRFVKLDARSGKVLLSRSVYLRDPDTGRENDGLLDGHWMYGLMYDIPSMEGDHIFMNQGCITLDGVFVPKVLPHLYRPGGFVGGPAQPEDLGRMAYGGVLCRGVERAAHIPKATATSASVLVYDDDYVYGGGARVKISAAAADDSHSGKRRGGSESGRIGLRNAQAMFIAGERLVMAGENQLVVAKASTGDILSTTPIEGTPVRDGICSSRGRVVLTLTSGEVICLQGGE